MSSDDAGDVPVSVTSNHPLPTSPSPASSNPPSDAQSLQHLADGQSTVQSAKLDPSSQRMVEGRGMSLQGTRPASDAEDNPETRSYLNVRFTMQEPTGEWADAEHESKRVKVYELINSRWADRGTAFCFGHVQEDSNEASLVARDETDYNNIILSTTIRANDVYQQQAETLIVWTEPDGVDYALSFQDADGCFEVWNFIQEVQQHLRGAEAELVLTSLPVEAPSLTVNIIRSGRLPQPQLGTIELIERAIKILSRTGLMKERICAYIFREQYIKSLIEVFSTAEDLESLENLHALSSLMYTILIMLNDHSMYEHIVEDDNFLGVIGMLEYDPEFPTHKANYRDFIQNVSRFRHPIRIRSNVILNKVHHTYRLQFMKDVVLARALDDSTLNMLNSCIIFNQLDIINFVQLNPYFLRDVVALYVNEEAMKSDAQSSPGPVQKFTDFTGPGQEFGEWTDAVSKMAGQQGPNGANAPEPTNDAYAFALPDDLSEQDFAQRVEVLSLILHLCSMAKHVQLASRLTLFRTLIDRGILFAVQWALGLPEKDEESKVIISNGGEILSALLDHDLNGVRGHVLKQVVAIEMERQAKKRGAEKAETILALMCRVMASSRDLAVQNQVGDALKSLLDVPQDDGVNTHLANGVKLIARGGKDELGNEKFLDYFYKHCINILFKPFTDIPPFKTFADSTFTLTREKTNLYLHLCDLLCNFVLQHSFRSHFFLLSSNYSTQVATLLKARDKHLRLAAFRLYRTFLKLNNRNLFNHMMKLDLLLPILSMTLQESRRDNLLSSSCQEFFDHIRRENFKDLIKHCMTHHEDLIRKLTETPLGGPRFKAFISRWEMNNEPLPPEESKIVKPEPRPWPGPTRHMEAEEEMYFNADDDEDDTIIPSISAPLNRGMGPGPLAAGRALKRKRRVAITGGSRLYRPPNVSAALRTSSPPLGSLVDYDEDEDDLGMLGGEGRASGSGRAILRGQQQQQHSRKESPPPTIEIPSPFPQRPLLDDDEDNLLEALARSKASSSSSSSSSATGVSQPPYLMGSMRLGEKRRRAEEEQEEDELEGRLERLSKSKRSESTGSSSRRSSASLERATSSKSVDGPPKKIRLKFSGSLAPSETASSFSTTTRSQAPAKDGDTG